MSQSGNQDRPLILITNDDGHEAPGIAALAEILEPLGRVISVAPDRERSGAGHALTLDRPLRVRTLAKDRYAINGTPTDCIHLGLDNLTDNLKPDLVVSGINRGLNIGDDVTYSGTVSATFEGTLLGIPSVAFSQEVAENFSFAAAARFAGRFVETLCTRELPKDLLLNVNIPAGEITGLSFTKLGHRVYKQSVVEKKDPRGRRYFWIAGTPEWKNDEGTDHAAVTAGRISVTPLHLDLTDYRGIDSYEWLTRELDVNAIADGTADE